jgi:hypothetical protein
VASYEQSRAVRKTVRGGEEAVMGLLTRFRKEEAVDLPPAWMNGSEVTLVLQRLGPEGYSLRDPETNASLMGDEDRLADAGAMVVNLVDIATRGDSQRRRVSQPGLSLTLVPDGRRLAVYDGVQHFDIGYVEDATARALLRAMEQGARLQAISLWERTALDGSRSELCAVIAPEDAELIFSIDAPPTFAG